MPSQEQFAPLVTLGSPFLEALEDPEITEVRVNGDGRIWFQSGSKHGTPRDFLGGGAAIEVAQHEIDGFVRRSADAAQTLFNEANPELVIDLPSTPPIRLSAVRDPFLRHPSQKRCCAIVLRKLSTLAIPLSGSENGYLETGILEEAHLRAIRECLLDFRSILLCGTIGSGKTTFASAILHELNKLAPARRVVVFEATPELLIGSPDHIRLSPYGGKSLEDVLPFCFNSGAHHALVGEVRGPEASELLQLWESGHPGVATFHADEPLDALRRFDALCQRKFRGSQHIRIAGAIDLILVLRSLPEPPYRKLSKAVWVRSSPAPNQYELEELGP